MKKKFLAIVLALSLLGTVISGMAFADDTTVEIQTGAELKKAFAEQLKDGKMTAQEKQQILNNASEAAVEELVMEKLEDVADLLTDPTSENIKFLPEGKSYVRYETDLDDGCSLNIELSDRSEKLASGIRMMETFGSSSLWKEYGNRYFTAKTTISCGSYSITISLENHYALSVDGITERYGKPNITPSQGNLVTTKGEGKISKARASTVGSSTEIYCQYSAKTTSMATQKYKMITTVKYLAHNKTTKKIQVGQSWDLVKQ